MTCKTVKTRAGNRAATTRQTTLPGQLSRARIPCTSRGKAPTPRYDVLWTGHAGRAEARPGARPYHVMRRKTPNAERQTPNVPLLVQRTIDRLG
jgi:hypothetical protein